MKVERDYGKITPIKITLEEDHELEGLFHILNCGYEFSLDHYMSNGEMKRNRKIMAVKKALGRMLRDFYERRC